MYSIIPLNEKNLQTLRDNNSIQSSTSYIVSLDLISKLIAMDKFPIKNKYIAINNILEFIKFIQNSISESTILSIHSTKLASYFSIHKYVSYMKLLSDLKVITQVPHKDGTFYTPKISSKQYRVHNDYLNSEMCLCILDNKDKISLVKDNKYAYKFEKTIIGVEINYKNSILAEFEYNLINPDNTKLVSRINKILSLNGERYIKKGNKVDRVYHSLSNLSRISRKYLSIDGKIFNDIDIVNCQPLLLCYLLKTLNLPIDSDYLYNCQLGILYDSFIGDLNRDKVKTELYRCIFFDFKPNQSIAIKFKELYPLTYTSLELLDKEPETLASKLQNIEASIFNNLLPNKSKYYYTLFDSIYFTDINDCSQLINDIRNKFKNLDIVPMLTMNGGTEYDIEDLN